MLAGREKEKEKKKSKNLRTDKEIFPTPFWVGEKKERNKDPANVNWRERINIDTCFFPPLPRKGGSFLRELGACIYKYKHHRTEQKRRRKKKLVLGRELDGLTLYPGNEQSILYSHLSMGPLSPSCSFFFASTLFSGRGLSG